MSKMKEIYSAMIEGDVTTLAEMLDDYHQPDTTAELDEQITNLTEEYQYLIATDHHKDRDCHWSIVRTWSYGEDQLWSVTHSGYCYKDIDISCSTYREAQQVLIEELTSAIENFKMFASTQVSDDEYEY